MLKYTGVLILVLGGVLLLTGCGVTAATAPATQTYEIILGEGQVLEEVGGKDQLTGEYHRWEPPVLVANKGDKIVLKVKNPRKNVHSLSIPGYGQDTGPLAPRTGEKTLEFTADRAGVFTWACATVFDEAKGDCDPDHANMVGHLVVLSR